MESFRITNHSNTSTQSLIKLNSTGPLIAGNTVHVCTVVNKNVPFLFLHAGSDLYMYSKTNTTLENLQKV